MDVVFSPGSLFTAFVLLAFVTVWASTGFRAAVTMWAELALAGALTALMLGWQPWT